MSEAKKGGYATSVGEKKVPTQEGGYLNSVLDGSLKPTVRYPILSTPEISHRQILLTKSVAYFDTETGAKQARNRLETGAHHSNHTQTACLLPNCTHF